MKTECTNDTFSLNSEKTYEVWHGTIELENKNITRKKRYQYADREP